MRFWTGVVPNVCAASQRRLPYLGLLGAIGMVHEANSGDVGDG